MSTLRPDRDALLLEYRLKFELLEREETTFSRLFPAVVLISATLLGAVLSDFGAAPGTPLRFFVGVTNLFCLPLCLIYYVYVRNRFYAYAKRLDIVARHLGVEGYFWDDRFDPDRRPGLTLPFVGLAALVLGLCAMWVQVLFIQ